MAAHPDIQTYLASEPNCAVASAFLSGHEVDIHFQNSDAETRFELGSITKVFTGILLCEAADQGLCSLDSPLAEFLPSHVPMGWGKRITLRHLATHTSGLPRLPLGMLSSAGSSQPYASWDRSKTLQALAKTPLFRRPGVAYSYSNFGFAVLGLALETVLAKPYAEAVEDLTRKLGCPGIRLRRAGDASHTPDGRDIHGKPVAPWDFASFEAAGGLTSNLNGVIQFAKKCLAPLNAPSLAESMTERTKTQPAIPLPTLIATTLMASGVAAGAADSIFAPILAIGGASYLSGPVPAVIGSLAWTLATLGTHMPVAVVGQRLGFGLCGVGIGQSLSQRRQPKQLGIAWHVLGGESSEIIWHNGGTSGFSSFLGLRPSHSSASIVLAACRQSVDQVALKLLR